jgi:aryl-phospho-beta-D-glucosidase BglC (GH1 family)
MPRNGGKGKRRRRRWLLLILAVLAVAGLADAYLPAEPLVTHVAAARRPAAGRLPWLSTNGTRVVDEQGRTVLLRGFNTEALVEYGDRAAYSFSTDDAAMVHDAGFNVIRLAISWSRLEPSRGSINTAYLDQIDNMVSMLEQHGLYTVLDMHFTLVFGPHFGGAGAPTWATLPAVPGFEWSSVWALKYVIAPDAHAAYAYSLIADDWQRDFRMVWQAVAKRFHYSSSVAGYDIRNEPYPLPPMIPPRIFEKNVLWPFYARMIDSIGAVDPNHIFMVENSLPWPNELTPIRAPNLVYAAHMWPGVFEMAEYRGNRKDMQEEMRKVAQEANILGAPLWVGETGNNHTRPYFEDWTQTLLDTLDDLGAGWAWWQWKETRNWGVRDGSNSPDLSLLRRLARPYLAATPQGVRAGRGDGIAGALDLTVDAQHEHGTVEVAWPKSTLSAPAVSGACLLDSLWEPSAARVLIDLAPGAGCVIRLKAT